MRLHVWLSPGEIAKDAIMKAKGYAEQGYIHVDID